MKKFLTVVGAVLFVFSSNAFAAENAPYIEGHVGGIMPRDIELEAVTAAQGGELRAKEREAFGGEIGIANVAGSGFRIAASALSSTLHIDEGCVDGAGCAAISDKRSTQFYMGRVYYDFVSSSPITPFVGFGAGFSEMAGDVGTDLAWSAAVGVNYNITDNIYLGLRGEYFYTYIKEPASAGTREIDGADVWSGALVLGFKF
jgi:opacity protein-like surface antigen